MSDNQRGQRPGILAFVADKPQSGTLAEILGDTCHVTLTGSDAEFLRLAAQHPAPDLILIDWLLPGKAGLELCHALKASPQTTNIPIIFLTSKGAVDDEVQVFAAGAVDYLHKPLNPPVVRARIRMHLALSRQRQILKQRTEQLEALNKELESFCYSVSHDLRAPLRAVRGFSQALLDDHAAGLAPQAQDYLQRVLSAGERMDELIVDMLELSRVSRSQFTRETVDLSQLVRTTAEQICQRHPHRDISIHVQDNLLVQGDARLLHIAVENLLENACKFTAQTVQPRIEFGSRVEAGTTVHFIRDNGIGFDPRYADKLFLPFQRLHNYSDYPGTGIGLATVQRVISRHGGRIWGKSAVGEGAEFCFTLAGAGEL